MYVWLASAQSTCVPSCKLSEDAASIGPWPIGLAGCGVRAATAAATGDGVQLVDCECRSAARKYGTRFRSNCGSSRYRMAW